MFKKSWLPKRKIPVANAPSRRGVMWVVIVVVGMTIFPLLVLLIINLQSSGI